MMWLALIPSKLKAYGAIAIVALLAGLRFIHVIKRNAVDDHQRELEDADRDRADDIRDNAANSVRDDTSGYRD